MKCRLCEREAVESKPAFCRYHQNAYRNLKADFERWRHAYGEMDWTTYLRRVTERPETGVWVKECCELLLKDADRPRDPDG